VKPKFLAAEPIDITSAMPTKRLFLAGLLISLAAAFVFGQTSTKKTAPSHARPDDWQKSKECAAQAEKVITDWTTRAGSSPNFWSNHYSPKYDKYFVSISNFTSAQEPRGGVLSTTDLLDAFERSALAHRYEAICVGDCSEQIKIMIKAAPCSIDQKTVDCEEAKAFISEHMKN
jgi:hypothetical protein